MIHITIYTHNGRVINAVDINSIQKIWLCSVCNWVVETLYILLNAEYVYIISTDDEWYQFKVTA